MRFYAIYADRLHSRTQGSFSRAPDANSRPYGITRKNKSTIVLHTTHIRVRINCTNHVIVPLDLLQELLTKTLKSYDKRTVYLVYGKPGNIPKVQRSIFTTTH